MQVRAVLVLVAVVLVAGFGWSQSERLGDVAGSIKLDPNAIVAGGGVVHDPTQSRRSDEALLEAVLADASDSALRFDSVLQEARASTLYRGGDLDLRLETAATRLADAAQEITYLHLVDDLTRPLESARRAAEACGAAAESVFDELALRGIAFTRAAKLSTDCRAGLDEASQRLNNLDDPGADSATSSSPETAEGIDWRAHRTADERIAELCAPQRSLGPAAYNACENLQYRALASIEARSAVNEMLADDVFAGIRESCRLDHPDDLVQLDQCEQERLTAARIELEAAIGVGAVTGSP